jgi:hypothetical protein
MSRVLPAYQSIAGGHGYGSLVLGLNPTTYWPAMRREVVGGYDATWNGATAQGAGFLTRDSAPAVDLDRSAATYVTTSYPWVNQRDWSVMGWVREDTYSANSSIAFGTAGNLWMLYAHNTVANGWIYYDGAGAGFGLYGQAEIHGHDWFVCLVHNNTAHTLVLYAAADRGALTSVGQSRTVSAAVDGNFTMGGRFTGLGLWDGRIGPVATFSRVLTLTEITALYYGGLHGS